MAANEKQAQSQPQTHLSEKELSHFRDLIISKRADACDEIDSMTSRLEDAQEQAAGYHYHMADGGTDAMEREKLTMMIARQQKYIGYLNRALKRIDNGTYGICKLSGEPIPKERLEAVPHTETTVAAKLADKKKRH